LNQRVQIYSDFIFYFLIQGRKQQLFKGEVDYIHTIVAFSQQASVGRLLIEFVV